MSPGLTWTKNRCLWAPKSCCPHAMCRSAGSTGLAMRHLAASLNGRLRSKCARPARRATRYCGHWTAGAPKWNCSIPKKASPPVRPVCFITLMAAGFWAAAGSPRGWRLSALPEPLTNTEVKDQQTEQALLALPLASLHLAYCACHL